MRTVTACLTVLIACSVNATEPVQRPVKVNLGPKAYRDGDVVQIISVTSTSSRFEQGDTVTVKGRVRLDSAAKAKLCLYVTQTKGDGLEESDSTQEVLVNRGLSTFKLTTTIKHRGRLHITLYRTNDGKPFGGVYFGTEPANEINDQSKRQALPRRLTQGHKSGKDHHC